MGSCAAYYSCSGPCEIPLTWVSASAPEGLESCSWSSAASDPKFAAKVTVDHWAVCPASASSAASSAFALASSGPSAESFGVEPDHPVTSLVTPVDSFRSYDP